MTSVLFEPQTGGTEYKDWKGEDKAEITVHFQEGKRSLPEKEKGVR